MVFLQVERFLDTENAALISMHYPQAQREVHFGTAPFDRKGTADGDEDKDGGAGGGGDEESEETGSGSTEAPKLGRGAAAGGSAGEKLSSPSTFRTAAIRFERTILSAASGAFGCDRSAVCLGTDADMQNRCLAIAP